MSKKQSQGKALKETKLNPNEAQWPKGWRKDSNAVPLPFSRPWAESKHRKGVEIVGSLGDTIEQVGLGYLLEHLECICDEQATLYGDGLEPVFPKDEGLAQIWSYFAKRFRDMHKFTVAYQPRQK